MRWRETPGLYQHRQRQNQSNTRVFWLIVIAAVVSMFFFALLWVRDTTPASKRDVPIIKEVKSGYRDRDRDREQEIGNEDDDEDEVIIAPSIPTTPKLGKKKEKEIKPTKEKEPEEEEEEEKKPSTHVHTHKGYTFWSNDFHISPIADIKHLFGAIGMNVIDKSLSGHCHLKGTCATDLKVLTKENGIALSPCPNQVKRAYFDAYVNDEQFKEADAFICHHPSAMCEVFMPFNRPMVVHASTRFEMGRHEPERWTTWVNNLRRIAENPMNIVAANNLYDAEYVKYFTGLKNVEVIPNYCGYLEERYNPSRKQILVGPGHVDGTVLNQLKQHNDDKLEFAHVRELYPTFKYSDLTAHRAIVLIPYQLSIMSLFEYYRMGIPLFAPSIDLLTDWHMEHQVLGERTWDSVFHKPGRKSAIDQHPDSNIPYDPNNEFDRDAVRYWVKYADFYQWPHITLFDSWDELLEVLRSPDIDAKLKKISDDMEAWSSKHYTELLDKWERMFTRMFADRKHGEFPKPDVSEMTYDDAMKTLYGDVGDLSGC